MPKLTVTINGQCFCGQSDVKFNTKLSMNIVLTKEEGTQLTGHCLAE